MLLAVSVVLCEKGRRSPLKRKISISLTVSLMALTAALTFVLTLQYAQNTFNRKISEVDRLSEKYQRLEELDAKVQSAFYPEPDEEEVVDGILRGYISGLGDRYSAYRSESELESYEDSNAGIYTGIGITITRNDEGYGEIVGVTEGGAAEGAGLVPGDVLLEVEEISLAEHYAEAVAAIAGENGTKVSVKIRRADSGQVQKMSLMRTQLDEVTVESEMLFNRIGYIRITKFRTVTVQQFETARQDLMQRGAQAMIFDVRDNGGGVLAALEQIADPLLPEGELAFAIDKFGNSDCIIESDAAYDEMPYAVLVNGNSASASELFACLLRDYSGAILVGEKTFGKGIMQTTFALSKGGVTLTTATYETGVTPCYHGIGLEPDILVTADELNTEDGADPQKDAAFDALVAKIAEKNDAA